MPKRDGTGPMGAGAMTGRGLGFCEGADPVRYGYGRGIGAGPRGARGCGRGRGPGRGYGRGFAVQQQPSRTRRELLSERKAILQSRIEAIDKQLESL
jgi:hypothetical protein